MAPASPRDRIITRLASIGVPRDCSPPALVDFLRRNDFLTADVIPLILPPDADLAAARKSSKSTAGSTDASVKDLLSESLLWVKWLMFGSDPQTVLYKMGEESAGQRAVCGAVWGHNDLAYRCRTCENDGTCAICVTCFMHGDHRGHDYSIIYTGGGCCDCGDETAWQREGFCSKHKGAEKIQPLEEGIAGAVGPVLDALLVCWREKVKTVEKQWKERDGQRGGVCLLAANELTSAVVEMLMEFCNCTESLLSFISRRMFECSGLLEVLVWGERFLDRKAVKKLHELLLKLLSDPVFKCELAKVFVKYYPFIVSEMVKHCSDSMLEKYPLLQSFSVQIFTVPNLTPRLVREDNLLGVLMGCLGDLFISCIGEDGRLQGTKWAGVYETTLRLVEDTRYAMVHSEIPKYIAEQRPDIARTWIRLLSLVQGMDAQKRVSGVLTEDENENLPAPFVLAHYLGNVSKLLVEGAFAVEGREETKDSKSGDGTGCSANSGKLYQKSYGSSTTTSNSGSDCAFLPGDANSSSRSSLYVPSSVVWLILECLKAIESWMAPDIVLRSDLSSPSASSSSGSNTTNLRKKLFKIRKGSNRGIRVYRVPTSTMVADEQQESPFSVYQGVFGSSSWLSGRLDVERRTLDQNSTLIGASGSAKFSEDVDMSGASDDSHMEFEFGTEPETFRLLNTEEWPDIVYDVSSQEVSFHIPLHSMLSFLFRKTLRACYSKTEKIDKANDISSLPSPGHSHDFFKKVLGGLHPSGFSALVMEHPLRLRVFCAQVRAGMWRKNGDAAVISSEWYRSVQWLEQGLESDLFLLQCCAALAPPESFVKKIQEKFGLSNYSSLNVADYTEYEPVLVQEMLTLIIQIVQERRYCGLSTAENLRRELVYKLATGDATHSQLVKALPREISKSDQLQDVLDTLAVYSNPSGLKQGKYSLRKEQWKELDLYHPRWNSKDLQAAEERYIRFCKVSALNVQLPQWTGVVEPLRNISRVATSRALFRIILAVLFYSLVTERSAVSRAPDGVLITALHLLSLILDLSGKQSETSTDKGSISHGEEDMVLTLTWASEELNTGFTNEFCHSKNQSMLSLLASLMKKHKEESHKNYAETRQCNISSLIENILKKFAHLSSVCMSNIQLLAPDVVFGKHSPDMTPQNQSSCYDSEKRRAKARQRQAAIMEKMRAEQSKFIASVESSHSDESATSLSKQEVDHVSEESIPVCSLCRDPDSDSPLCFLILLQKSRLISFAKRRPPSWEDASQLDKDTLLANKGGTSDPSGSDSSSPMQRDQNEDLEFAFDVQPTQVDAFVDFFGERLPDVGNFQLPNISRDTGPNPMSFELMENDIYQSVKGAVLNQASHSDALDIDLRCSTSYTTVGSKGSNNAESSLLSEYVTSLSKGSSRQQRSMYELLHIANVSSGATVRTANFNCFSPRDCDGIHISSCGHAVHQDCHERYLLSLKQRNIRRLGFEVGHIVDPDMGELLCPVCRRFANSILPAFPGSSNITGKGPMTSTSGPPARAIFSSNTDNCSLHLPLALSLLQSTSKMVGQGRFLRIFSGKQSETIEPSLEPALRKLCMLYYPNNYDTLSGSGRLNHSLILWDTLRYSLTCTEIASRDKLKTGAFSSVSCLETLYGEFHSSSGFIMSLLLRSAQSKRSWSSLEVLLRFRGIQHLAGSICSGVSGDKCSDKRRGTISSFLERADKGESFPDIQFWKQAADPVLAHDPFSSLMWLLFCLPLPFTSTVEFFIPLVHLFYAVSVVQAMITCYSKEYFDTSSFGDHILNDLCKTIGQSEAARKYFATEYMESSCYPKDAIRRLTFPYLRRCALLWKLLQSSSLTPVFDSPNKWEVSKSSMKNNAVDCTNHLTIELNGIRELEDMFQIHPLDSVLRDENVNAIALKWCEHFCAEYKSHDIGGTLVSTPAVPFKLLQLPRLYQDLLQRYIKLQCSDCKSIPNEPALCLLCGKLCSPSWKSCCRANRCLNHAITCGAGIGVFLLVRRTTILLQRSSRQAVWPSPYLDAFGEEDVDMYRGKPLYLNDERYSALSYLVASHGLDRSSEVLRHTTISLYGSD